MILYSLTPITLNKIRLSALYEQSMNRKFPNGFFYSKFMPDLFHVNASMNTGIYFVVLGTKDVIFGEIITARLCCPSWDKGRVALDTATPSIWQAVS